MGNHFNYWKKTQKIKPFETMKDWNDFVEDCCKLPSLQADIKNPAAMKKSKIHKGIDEYGNKLDSEYEFVVAEYFRKIKGFVVERNKTEWLPYYTDDGKLHKWIWDFRIAGLIYEVKGRLTDNDSLKMKTHPNVIWIFGEDVKEMRKELDEKHPGWMTNFTRTN